MGAHEPGGGSAPADVAYALIVSVSKRVSSGSLGAVVFDFDGLLVDTETAVFAAGTAVLATMGHVVTREQWSTLVGQGENDSWAALCAAVGCELDREQFDRGMWSDEAPWRGSIALMPGVAALVDELQDAGVPRAIASSSSAAWIEPQLERHGLLGRFDVLATADRVGGRTKPAPDVYLLACDELGVAPCAAVALEDSAPGIAAAVAAGLCVVSVPNDITCLTDLSSAHHTVPSLEHLTLAELEALVSGHDGGRARSAGVVRRRSPERK